MFDMVPDTFFPKKTGRPERTTRGFYMSEPMFTSVDALEASRDGA